MTQLISQTKTFISYLPAPPIPISGKKILVTGGAGFVGSALCNRLYYNSNKVVSLDNYFTGSSSNHYNNSVEYIKGSTVDISNLIDFTPDIVYHLGEYSRVEQSFEDIKLVHEYNIQGTTAVLEFVKHRGSKLIYAGSSTKFVDEPGYVQSPYAWSKAKNTELVMKYHEWFGIDYAITYFYNVYGPGEISKGRYATLIAKYLDFYKNGKSLPVVLPGTQQRNFTHINDIVDALLLVGANGSGDEYGIGHPDAYSIEDVANMFVGANVNFLPERRGNRNQAPVISDRTIALGWKPRYNLPDYIKGLL